MPYNPIDPALATPIPVPDPNPAAPLIGAGAPDEYEYPYEYGLEVVSDGLTLAQARDELKAMLAHRTDVLDSRIDFWLNRAYVDLATSLTKHDELKFSLEFETEPDQSLYLLDGIVVTTLVATRRDDDNSYGGVPLEKIDLPTYRRRKTLDDVAERPPREFFRQNNVLVLWPTPDKEYPIVLDFRFEPLPLTEDFHVPVLRPEWHESWLMLARKKILSALSEWEASMAVNNEFIQHVRVRKDREGDEEELKTVSSSVPRNEAMLRRRSVSREHPISGS